MGKIFIIFVFTSSCIHSQEQAKKSLPKYNVVFISVDNVRADHLGLYGYAKNTSPNLDKWAGSAQVFENFYSSTPMTVTSEGSVFTGRYPFENGLISFEHSFDPEVETITAILSKNGYKTVALGDSPEYRVFPSIVKSFKPFFNYYERMPLLRVRLEGSPPKATRNVIDLPKMEKFLDKVNSDNFFMWLPIGMAHSPFGYPFENKFSDENYKGPLKFLERFHGGNLWLYRNILYPVTPETSFSFSFSSYGLIQLSEYKHLATTKLSMKAEDLNWITDRYDDGIYAFDTKLAEILNIFEKRDLTKNTIFVLYSNHGEEFNEHGYFGHFDIYQGSIHVPLVIKSPSISIAKRHRILATSIDILPTLLAMLGIEPPPKTDGLNLFTTQAEERKHVFLLRTPLWESIVRVDNQPSIWDDFRFRIKTEDYMEPTIITSQYKLIHRRARSVLKKYSIFQFVSDKTIEIPEYEMYDLEIDPLEQKNLAGTSKVFAGLKQMLLEFEERMVKKKYNPKKIESTIQDYR